MIALRSMFRVDPLAPRVERPFGVAWIAGGFLAFGLLKTVSILAPIASALASIALMSPDDHLTLGSRISLILGTAIALSFVGAYYAYAFWIWRGEPVARVVSLALAWFMAAFSSLAIAASINTWMDRSLASVRLGSTAVAVGVFAVSLTTLEFLYRPSVKSYFSSLEAARRRIAARKELTLHQNEEPHT